MAVAVALWAALGVEVCEGAHSFRHAVLLADLGRGARRNGYLVQSVIHGGICCGGGRCGPGMKKAREQVLRAFGGKCRCREGVPGN